MGGMRVRVDTVQCTHQEVLAVRKEMQDRLGWQGKTEDGSHQRWYETAFRAGR